MTEFRITLDDKAMGLLSQINENLKKLGGDSQPSAEVVEKVKPNTTKAAAKAEKAPEPHRETVIVAKDEANDIEISKVTITRIEDVREAVGNFARRNGKDSALRLLKKYGVKSVSEIPQEKWAEVLEACK